MHVLCVSNGTARFSMFIPTHLELPLLERAQHEVAKEHGSADELISVLVQLLETHDASATSHAFSVAIQADVLALGLGLAPERRQLLWRSALLHDIGKLAVPRDILHYPGRLGPEALAVIRQHPVIGADLLDRSQVLKDVAIHVRHHHERWDGGGYPYGLRGEAIPIEARIIGLCDAMHAMSMNRPYQASRNIAAILAEIERCAGSQFDPALTGLLLMSMHRYVLGLG